jgi:hypothetical protein
MLSNEQIQNYVAMLPNQETIDTMIRNKQELEHNNALVEAGLILNIAFDNLRDWRYRKYDTSHIISEEYNAELVVEYVSKILENVKNVAFSFEKETRSVKITFQIN